MTPWRVSFVRRWHTNPDLCHTLDPVAAHSGHMGILALDIWGKDASRELLAACLVHDLGEWASGDIPFPAKTDPELREAADRLEVTALADMGLLYDLSERDTRRLRYLDRLDAYLWAQHHNPGILDRDGWPEALAWLEQTAKELTE